ncbi:MAG: diaminopimelate epimerase [Turicibacter sp.]|nr:diaminopimelate epimerase [Turicibacter sp.]
MKVSFYEGLGNTFCVVDAVEGEDYSALAPLLCNRFKRDGLIVVKTSPLEMVFYNQDGSQSPMCGNGIRCFAKYVQDEGLVSEDSYHVETLAGTMKVEVQSRDPFMCKINMGRPVFSNCLTKVADDLPLLNRQLEVDGQVVDVNIVFMGTIHTVLFVEDAVAMVGSPLGEKICNHPLFLEHTNVNFVQAVNPSEIVVRTFERGVGWTKACGTGCCASVVIARRHGLVTGKVKVRLELGDLFVEGDDEVFMTGPATFEGKAD